MNYLIQSTFPFNFGVYSVHKITLEDARAFAEDNGLISCVYTDTIVDLLATLLGLEVADAEVERPVPMQTGDKALIFRLLSELALDEGEPPTPHEYTLEEAEALLFEFGILERM